MSAMHNKHLCWIVLYILTVLITPTSQELKDVSIDQYDPVRLGQQATLRCVYEGTDLDLQLVTWSKRYTGGRTSFVYEYDVCADTSNAFNELADRATMTLEEAGVPTDNRILDIDSNAIPRPKRSLDSLNNASIKNTKPPNETNFQKTKSFYNVDAYNKNGSSLFVPSNKLELQNDPTGTNDVLKREKRADGELHDLMKTLKGMMEENGHVTYTATDVKKDRGVAILEIKNVRLDDEGVYECSVKVKRASPMSDSSILSTLVLPGTPRMNSLAKAVAESDNLELVCRANLGRPVGKIIWSRQRIGEMNFWAIPDDQTTTELTRHSNGTTSAVSTVTVQVEAEDDGAIYKCETVSDALKSWEELPFDHVILNVFYPPRNGKILYDSASDRYYCHVQAKPQPSYVWLWIQEDGTKTIMSADQYLDMSSIEDGGYLRFRCLGSNIIHGVRHTSLMDTRLNVASKPDNEQVVSRTTTPRPYNARSNSRPRGNKPWENNEVHDDPIWDVVSAEYGANDVDAPDTRNMVSNTMPARIPKLKSDSQGTRDISNAIPYTQGMTLEQIMRNLNKFNNPDAPTPTSTTTTTPLPTTIVGAEDFGDFDDPMELFLDNIDNSMIDAVQRRTNEPQNPDDTNTMEGNARNSRFDYDYSDFDPYYVDSNKFSTNAVQSTDPKYLQSSSEYQKLQRMASTLSKQAPLKPKPKLGIGRNGIASLDSINAAMNNIRKHNIDVSPTKATILRPLPTTVENGISQRRKNYFDLVYGKSLKGDQLNSASVKSSSTKNTQANEVKRKNPPQHKDIVHLPGKDFIVTGLSPNKLPATESFKDFLNINLASPKSSRDSDSNNGRNDNNDNKTPQQNIDAWFKKYMKVPAANAPSVEATATPKSKLLQLLTDPNPLSPASQAQLDSLLEKASLDELVEVQNLIDAKGNSVSDTKNDVNTPKFTPTLLPKIRTFQHSVEELITSRNKNNNNMGDNRDNRVLLPDPRQLSSQSSSSLNSPNPLPPPRAAAQQNPRPAMQLAQRSQQQPSIRGNTPPTPIQNNFYQQGNNPYPPPYPLPPPSPTISSLPPYQQRMPQHNQNGLHQDMAPFQGSPRNGPGPGPGSYNVNPQRPQFQSAQPFSPPPPQQNFYTPPPPPQPQYQQQHQQQQQQQQFFNNNNPGSMQSPPPSRPNIPNLPLTGNYDAIHSGSGVFLRKSNDLDGPLNDYIHGVHGVSSDPFSYRQQQFPAKVFSAFKDGGDEEVAAAHGKAFKEHIKNNVVEQQLGGGHVSEYEDFGDGSYHDEYEKVTATTHKEYDCRRKNDGTYGGGCRAFYRCEAGDTFLVECNSPNVHNRRTGHCDEPKNAPSPCGDWQDCSDKDNGKYADIPNGCKSYFTCHGGVFLGHNDCTPGTIFDDREQVCNWEDQVPPPCGKGISRKSRKRVKKRKYRQRRRR